MELGHAPVDTGKDGTPEELGGALPFLSLGRLDELVVGEVGGDRGDEDLALEDVDLCR
jgi:hypothetical protein